MKKFSKLIFGAVLCCCVGAINIAVQDALAEKVSKVQIADKELNLFKERVVITKGELKENLKDSIVLVESPKFSYKDEIAWKGITDQTQFFIASVSKQFTAVLMLKALSEKNNGDLEKIKEDLHRPLSELLKGTDLLKKLQDVPGRFKGRKPSNWLDQISLHELLSHTSGLENYTKKYASMINIFKDFGFYSNSADIIKIIHAVKFKKQTEKKFDYCDTNYAIIAKIIEQITGKDFIYYLNEKIIKPLGLKNTFEPKEGAFKEIKDKLKLTNLVLDEADSSMVDVKVLVGVGGIISTAQDMMKWTKALHTKGFVLPDELYELMTTPYIKKDEGNSAGYGIDVENSMYFKKILSRIGGMGHYRSIVAYIPEQELYIVVLSDNRELRPLIKSSLLGLKE